MRRNRKLSMVLSPDWSNPLAVCAPHQVLDRFRSVAIALTSGKNSSVSGANLAQNHDGMMTAQTFVRVIP